MSPSPQPKWLLPSLPPSKRVVRYREMAAEALKIAESSEDEAKRWAFTTIAAGWQALAMEAEHSNN